MSAYPAPQHRSHTALVLGGGGSAGNAWCIGVIAGLLVGGFDVTEADLLVGTSAGATAAAQISGASPTDSAGRHPWRSAAAAPPAPAGPGVGAGRVRTLDPPRTTSRAPSRIIAAAQDAGRHAPPARRGGARAGCRVGRLRARTVARHRGGSAAQPALAGSLDAHHGGRCPTPVNRSCSTATAESTWSTPSPPAPPAASPTASATTATSTAATAATRTPTWPPDTARVLVLSPLGGRTRHPLGLGHEPRRAGRRAPGTRQPVETILPDGDSLNAFGTNLMDPSTRPPAARAGCGQGRALAEQLSPFWL